MKAAIGCFIGLVLSVSVGAESLLEGRVRLDSGEPVADAQVRLFDLTDLRRGAIARAMTDGRGYFALPLAALAGSVLPQGFTLGPNYPNPFNPSTIIPYQLAASSAVRLEVFNLLGQHIATLVDGEQPAGFHTATWHATDGVGRAVGAGVYIYRMMVGVERQTGRMVLIDGQAGVSAGGAASVMPGASGIGGSDGADAQVYGLIVSGSGLVPYVDSSFRAEAGMAPVELVVSSGLHSAGKATDDDCAFCDLFGAFNDQQEDEEDAATEEEETTEEEEDEAGEGDLIVHASISGTSLTTEQAFTLTATVQNQGTDESQELVLSYYRSSNPTISTLDAPVGTDAVGRLAASEIRNESISLTAPSRPDTYYYGACVANVSSESDTPINCSTGVRVIVAEDETPEEEEDETPEEEGADGQDEILVFTDPQIYNDNVFVLPVTDNLVTLWTSSNSPPLEDYTARFYEHFNDEFDFLIFVANVDEFIDLADRPGHIIGGFFQHVKNDVQGIGLSIFSNNNSWGSAGKLQGVIFVTDYTLRGPPGLRPPRNHSAIKGGLLTHELLHRWAAFLDEPLSDGPHWNSISSIRGHFGGDFRSDFEEIVDLGGGRYTAAEVPRDMERLLYGPLDQYLVGFIPPEEVPDMWAAVDGETLFADREEVDL